MWRTVDIVLGVSVVSTTVRMLLVEGENADGVVVDQDAFEVTDGSGGYCAGPQRVVDRVVAAILGTREGAADGGYRLSSTGVTVTDQGLTALLRDGLAAHRVDNVMLVSAFLAAAALAQTVGGSVGYERTALLFIERDSATLAMVDSADGSIADVRRRPLSADDDTAVAELTAMLAHLDRFEVRPGGVFAVGSDGIDVGVVKPALDKATPLPVNVPEEPELALARGAGLASASAPLFSSSTQALAWAQDPGTGEVDPEVMALGYSYAPVYPADDEALAYSAVPDDADDAGDGQRRHPSFLLAAGALATLFVVGVAALVIAWAVDMRPTADRRPDTGEHIVVSAKPTPSPPVKAVPARPAPPPSAPPAPPSTTTAPPAPPPTTPAPAAPAAPTPAPAAPAAPNTPRHTVAPAPAHTLPPAAPPPPPPAPALPTLPGLPPMTMWLHLPFVSVPIPINAPAPPP